MKRIVINIDKDQFNLKSSEPLTFGETVQALLSILNATAGEVISNAAKKDQQKVRETIYDSLNIAFGNILEEIIPSEEIPSLEAAAILKAQNEIIAKARKEKRPLEEVLEEYNTKAEEDTKDARNMS